MAIAGDRLEAAYAIAFMGLRSSEILGIARSDLDLDNGTLTIRCQISGSGRRAARVETKTAASAATIPLPPFIVDRLRAHCVRQAAERPFVPFGDSLVFVTGKGLAINGSWFTKHFQSLLLRASLPTMRLHDMRHGAASLLVDAGAHPRVAQELLRHAPGSRVTMERYAHVTAGQQREAADLLEKAVAGAFRNQSPSQSRDSRKGSSRVGWRRPEWSIHSGKLAPAVGFEPTTWRLTAARSTTELRRTEVSRPGRGQRRAPPRCRARG